MKNKQIKTFLLVGLLLICMLLNAQSDQRITLDFSCQLIERQSVSIGVSYVNPTMWPISESELYQSLYWEKYLNDPSVSNIFTIGYSSLLGKEFLFAGFGTRFIYQDEAFRVDIAPMIKIGFKYVWLEFSKQILSVDNPFNQTKLNRVLLDRSENHVKIVFTIPIYRKGNT